jgi:hypothetical protein
LHHAAAKVVAVLKERVMSGKIGIDVTKRLLSGLGAIVAAGAYAVMHYKAAREEWGDIQGDELVAIAKQVMDTEIPKVVAVFKPDSTSLVLDVAHTKS